MRNCTICALASAWLLIGGAGTAHAQEEPISVPIELDVQNVNRTGVPCSAEGQSYTLHAELVGPRHALEGGAPATATLYLHEFSYDDFWHFRVAPGVDYATELARQGQVTVALDRLGYDDSPHPDGNATCLGAQADMAHQIVTALRQGAYRATGLAPRPFERVVLAGHSVGGMIAELAAFSFGEIDALMLFAGYHSAFSPRALTDGFKQAQVCAAGGEESGGSPHYASFVPRDEDVEYYGFADGDPAVIEAVKRTRHLDPCGDVNSLVPTAAEDRTGVGDVAVPVLLLWGRDDPVYTSDAGERQAAEFSGSSDVTTVYFERMKHAMVLERSAPQLRASVATWLAERGFGTAAPPNPAPDPVLAGCPVGGRVLAGTDGRDTLTGTRRPESLFGLGGRDSLYGGGGRDCLSGGAGADVLRAADGRRDRVRCGPGRDRAIADRRDGLSGCERVRRR